jgi:peptidyl-prolyl isomerase D
MMHLIISLKSLERREYHSIQPRVLEILALEANLCESRFPLLTNAALSALKTSPPSGSLAITLTTRALTLEPLTPAEKGKALYRRALGRIATKDDEGAEVDLKSALKEVPGDAGVVKALKDVEVRRKERKEKERKAYGKMFG